MDSRTSTVRCSGRSIAIPTARSSTPRTPIRPPGVFFVEMRGECSDINEGIVRHGSQGWIGGFSGKGRRLSRRDIGWASRRQDRPRPPPPQPTCVATAMARCRLKQRVRTPRICHSRQAANAVNLRRDKASDARAPDPIIEQWTAVLRRPAVTAREQLSGHHCSRSPRCLILVGVSPTKRSLACVASGSRADPLV